MWYQCYHRMQYPVINIVHMDNALETLNDSVKNSSFQEDVPNANSTMLESSQQNRAALGHTAVSHVDTAQNISRSLPSQSHGECQSAECSTYSVGHISHIPRTPPTPATYNIPDIINKSMGTENNNEDIFGMIKLGDNDVCYTSGTIEWVGRKRSFPINSGFKILTQNNSQKTEPVFKKIRLNSTYRTGVNNINECDCADVLPTVNAIVDHLNALHEAVDLVDLRLNNLEDVIGKKD